MSDLAELVGGVRAGVRRRVGQAITLVESRGEDGARLLAELHRTGRDAVRVGLTGPPGVGKSTLVGALVAGRRREGRTVGVISVDPTSPFTRGAVLGDRIRLVEHFTDPGVFIRSMASRGQLGGVSESTVGAITVLEAAGYDVVLVETVGAGQNEVDVQTLTDTVVLVLMPGSGDGVQALKAGVMEIPDVIVINKADHPSTAVMRAELEATLRLVPPADGWEVPVVETRATTGQGVDELWAAVGAHRAHLAEGDRLLARRLDGVRRQLRTLALARLGRALDAACPAAEAAALARAVNARELDPDGAAARMIALLGARP